MGAKQTMAYNLDRRSMLAVSAASLLATSAEANDGDLPSVTGPMVGHVSHVDANIWFRPTTPGKYSLQVLQEEGTEERIIHAEAKLENDNCLTWHVAGLQPGTKYQYKVSGPNRPLVSGKEYYFDTAPDPTKATRVCLAFGSCAPNKPLELWTQMEQRGAQGLVLLGDTPYIDSTDLSVARDRHRTFLQVPQLASLIGHTPTWGTWDDHDFGRNDSDGRLKGKENTRQAFVEYRANQDFGHDQSGIYTKFRYGPVEVFLLDTRWFARTEKSPVDPSQPTLLGKQQWQWLKEALLASTAPFKLIACGMIWDDKENTESDDWGSYTHERDALFEFIGENKISGVVLIGGDIHCSRHLKYETEKTVGYPIHQFIVSPIHDSVIPKLNVPHPNLIRGEAIPHVWLRLEVDSTQSPARLHAEWVQMKGRPMWDVTLTDEQLSLR
ncbi:alkaline phosphatase D family protein [Bremerella sp. P1]|uniref:alkaline phosphatase D family protein n=1 Tax=Bremerella sp. P1 TaxID=3026424 RepID=UPI00236862ED|nr:alkaline phosphatase D family protein [Bremerella sp. P1]WDI41922.1 alkaline phosphatase D family protein [Bremerella sp. P1]